MGSCLHQVLSADPRALQDCLASARPGDALLLVDAGIHALPGLAPHVLDYPLMALRIDAVARGLGAAAKEAGITLIDDAEWIEQVQLHKLVLSWK